MSAVEALRRTFASARLSRNFRLFLSGQFVSAIGTWINFTASGWLVWRLTHSGSALGVNSALAFGPMLILGAWGGVLADRFNKRKILISTQSAFAVLALVMATLIATHVIELWMVYTLSVFTGLVIAIDNPARQSFYVEMVGEAELTNAVSLNSAAFTGARVIGPAIAGVVIATAGMALCFGLDAVSYLFVLGALVAMRPRELYTQPRSSRDRGHLVAGLRYVWGTDELRRPLIVLAIMFTFVFQWQVLMPLLAEVTFNAGPREFGLLSAAAGVGAFVGAITTANRNRDPGLRRMGFFARSGRRHDAVRLDLADAAGGDAGDGPRGVRGHVLHDHRQHDVATERQAAGARARDGAVRDRVPGLDAVRRADRGSARPTPRPPRGVRRDGRAGDRCRRRGDGPAPARARPGEPPTSWSRTTARGRGSVVP